MRAPGRALLGALGVLALLLGGCSGDDAAPGPGPSRIQVDGPDLAAIKARTGMEDCAPGPGGGRLPAVTVACLGGGTPVDLSTLRGPMVLNLWASSCGPCREEMPVLQEFHSTYGDRVPVLGIDYLDTFPGTALEQIEERGVTYPSLADPGGELAGDPEFARFVGLPWLIYVDADGAVAYAEAGGVTTVEEVVAVVEEQLGVDL